MIKIKFLDIGLGTSTFIKTDNDVNIIFDCGQNSETGKNAFDELNGEPLNYLILTHPHKDHIEALTCESFRRPEQMTKNGNIPKELIEEQIEKAENNYDKKIFKKYKELNEHFTRQVPESQSYANPNNNGGINMDFFRPSPTSDELNDYSIAAFLCHDGYKILLMGDNTLSNIEDLLNDGNFKSEIENVDILLAPHHGRESCYSQEFMNHVNPAITIISDKPEDNNESASSKYSDNSRGMTILKNGKHEFRSCLTTRNDGDITVTINNSRLSISCEK